MVEAPSKTVERKDHSQQDTPDEDIQLSDDDSYCPSEFEVDSDDDMADDIFARLRKEGSVQPTIKQLVSKHPLHFLNLPLEIRHGIFKQLINTPHTIILYPKRKRHSILTAVLSTCQQLKSELEVYIVQNIFQNNKLINSPYLGVFNKEATSFIVRYTTENSYLDPQEFGPRLERHIAAPITSHQLLQLHSWQLAMTNSNSNNIGVIRKIQLADFKSREELGETEADEIEYKMILRYEEGDQPWNLGWNHKKKMRAGLRDREFDDLDRFNLAMVRFDLEHPELERRGGFEELDDW
ncbi:uncharacterized protein PAC_13770 [Phialocephala subalpina]|uniref:F-box domain-containing protein n=1 Tax=Phialocephala subalpina TaxID=576137 RepID=A0A1L7XFR8_9HELO|nr:uncharacterized protein PAC_13770 [Phialocephala subalpina]